MGRGIVKRLLSSLERAVEKLPDNRKGSNALTYAIGDAVKSTCQQSWRWRYLDKDNVKQLAECARARWKMRHKCRENEHNNVLKRRGYNLKHNGEPKVRTDMARTTPANYFVCSIQWVFCFTAFRTLPMRIIRKRASS
jgi:hypothetical protein